MNMDQLLDGVRRVAQLVELIGGPVAQVIGAGLEVTAEAIRVAAKDPAHDAAALLLVLRDQLRADLASEWQRALDETEPKG